MLPSYEVVELSLERLDEAGHQPVFGLCRIAKSERSEGRFSVGQAVLAPASRNTAGQAEVDARTCIPIPAGLLADRAMLVPRLAMALAATDAVALELGDVPICTSGGEDLHLIATVCQWRSGRDVLVLDLSDGHFAATAGCRRIDSSDPQRAIEDISRASATAPGAAAIVLSRKSDAVDILLEAMPMWGRMIISSAGTEPATIDFYNNVHRKGMSLVTGPASPTVLFEPDARTGLRHFAERAIQILRRDDLAAALCAPRV